MAWKRLVAYLSTLWFCTAALAAQPAPFTHLYDTGAPGARALPPRDAATWPAWPAVPEDNVTHKLAGGAVLLNDKLAVLLPRDGRAARVYVRKGAGWTPRTTVGVGFEGRTLRALQIAENSPAAVSVDLTFQSADGGAQSVRLRLTAGAAFLEARGGEGMSRLSVGAPGSWVVVPDLLAGDIVAVHGHPPWGTTGLPAENCVLSFLDGGQSILMCVWRSPEQNADLVTTTETRVPRMAGFVIECAKGQSVWVACLEGPGIWAAPSSGATVWDKLLGWKAPFPAKWRLDLAGGENRSLSWDIGAEPRPRLKQQGLGREMLIYPLDRSRDTPLTVLCPIDVLRNTLGVGPCQYILAAEGLGSADIATAAEVTRWVEKQFERKRARRKADEIRERLRLMAEHMGKAAARIRRYEQFAGRMRALCPGTDGGSRGPLAALRAIVDDFERDIAAGREAMKTPQHAERLAESMAGLIGKEDALTGVGRLGEELRAIGAAQDRTLARSRMAARRLKQWGRMAAAHPKAADLARTIGGEADGMLGRKGGSR